MTDLTDDLVEMFDRGPDPAAFTLLLMHGQGQQHLIERVLDRLLDKGGNHDLEHHFQKWAESLDPDTVMDPKGFFESREDIKEALVSARMILNARSLRGRT